MVEFPKATKRSVGVILLFFCFNGLTAQTFPKNINQAVKILSTECPDSLKILIKTTPQDSLYLLSYPWDTEYETIYNWTDDDNKKSATYRYFKKRGITNTINKITIILLAFKAYLLDETDTFDGQETFAIYKKREKEQEEIKKNRFVADSISGIYIPKDLEDCFRQIDSFWNDTTKNEVKAMTEDEFLGRTHFGFGMWIRNNWQLWGGSRLSKYFNEMEIFHPDDMSGIILTSYHRYLKGESLEIQAQVEDTKRYWITANNPEKDSSLINERTFYTSWLEKNNIPLQSLHKVPQNQIIITCDSTLAKMETNGDTVSIWTFAWLSVHDTTFLKKIAQQDNFGSTVYVKDYHYDGKYQVVGLSPKTFLTRNDSLYELETFSTISMDSVSALSKSMYDWMRLSDIDSLLLDSVFKSKAYAHTDSIRKIVNENEYSRFKLIFNATLFEGGKSYNDNIKGDIITLEDMWKIGKKKYYKILVKNTEDETSYSYIFDQNYKFIEFEGCNEKVFNRLNKKKSK